MSLFSKLRKLKIKINVDTNTTPETNTTKIYFNNILVWTGIIGLFVGMFQQNLIVSLVSTLLLIIGLIKFIVKFNFNKKSS